MDKIKRGTIAHEVFQVLAQQTVLDPVVSASMAVKIADVIAVHQAPDNLTMDRRVEHAERELAEAKTLIGTLREQAEAADQVKEQLVAALKLARVAIDTSQPTHSHYPEPVARHIAAQKAVKEALAAAGVVL